MPLRAGPAPLGGAVAFAGVAFFAMCVLVLAGGGRPEVLVG
ncbi:MAG: hypothetical protein ACLGIO_13455 [Acidimicrobiia bacterium]